MAAKYLLLALVAIASTQICVQAAGGGRDNIAAAVIKGFSKLSKGKLGECVDGQKTNIDTLFADATKNATACSPSNGPQFEEIIAEWRTNGRTLIDLLKAINAEAAVCRGACKLSDRQCRKECYKKIKTDNETKITDAVALIRATHRKEMTLAGSLDSTTRQCLMQAITHGFRAVKQIVRNIKQCARQ